MANSRTKSNISSHVTSYAMGAAALVLFNAGDLIRLLRIKVQVRIFLAEYRVANIIADAQLTDSSRA